MSKLRKDQSGYSAVEALLILVALAIVGLVGWYVHHATTAANTTYSIQESSQKPNTSKQNNTKITAPTTTAPVPPQ